MESFTADELWIILSDEIKAVGSQKAWAERAGLSPSYVNDVLNGRRPMAPRIACELGFKTFVVYRRDKG